MDDDLAELALGSLAGRQGAAAISHLEGCPRCSAEVDMPSAAADELVHGVVAVEPSVGFEAPVCERFGTPARPFRGPAWVAWLRRRPALALRALAVLAVVGIGILAAHQASTPWPTRTRQWRAYLPSERPERGGALPLRYPRRGPGHGLGRPPHLAVHVRGRPRLARRAHLPGVVPADGATVTLGHFRPSAGKGAWAASVSQPASRLRKALLTRADGEVLASAHLN